MLITCEGVPRRVKRSGQAAPMLAICLAFASLCASMPYAEAAGNPRSWQGQHGHGPGCPSGVPVLTLPTSVRSTGNTSDEADAFRGNATLHAVRPYTFAQAAQVAWDFDLISKGSWSEGAGGSRLWKLCVEAPGAHSLTFLFSNLRLPRHSADLYIYNPAATRDYTVCSVGCQRLTVHSVRSDGVAVTAPFDGDRVVLEYWQPASASGDMLRRSRTLAMQVESVLLGVRPLSLGARGSGAAESTSAASGPAAKQGSIFDIVVDAITGAGGSKSPAPASSPSPGAPGPEGAGDAVGNVPSALVAGATSELAMVDPEAVGNYLGKAVDQGHGNSLDCQKDVECDSDWSSEANAVVLLIGIDATSGFYCTATLINAPGNVQYLIGANHCLGTKSTATSTVYWGIVFNYESQCGSTVPDNVDYQLLQGLEVVWNNEVVDTMLLRLDDDIPSGYTPYFLGWDASEWAEPEDGVVCIHHPFGDSKKIAYTAQQLQMGIFIEQDPTHYVATWDEGAMEEGSSGSMLIDASTRKGLGPLTGGSETNGCQGGEDFFGSLYMGWTLGLGDFLGGPDGVDGPSTMGAREFNNTGPGLIVNPDLVVLEEGRLTAPLDIRLSEAPVEGGLLTVKASVLPSSGGLASPVTLATTELVFDSSNWEEFQTIDVIPGDDDVKDGLLTFVILLELSSDQDDSFYKRRTIPGVRLDDETPEGATPSQPIPIVLPLDSLTFKDSVATLEAGSVPDVTLGATTLQDFSSGTAQGAAVYYSLDVAVSLMASLQACSSDTLLEMFVFDPEGVAQWSTAASCDTRGKSDPCKSYEDESQCSGFDQFYIFGTDGAGPYVMAVTSRDQQAGTFSFEFSAKQGW